MFLRQRSSAFSRRKDLCLSYVLERYGMVRDIDFSAIPGYGMVRYGTKSWDIPRSQNDVCVFQYYDDYNDA